MARTYKKAPSAETAKEAPPIKINSAKPVTAKPAAEKAAPAKAAEEKAPEVKARETKAAVQEAIETKTVKHEAPETSAPAARSSVIAAPDKAVAGTIVYSPASQILTREAAPNESFAIGDSMPVYYL